MSSSLFPLEKLLKEKCKGVSAEFPEQNVNYFDRYQHIKVWLTKDIYPQIGSGLSRDGGIYTSHGADHFDQVILYAGLLIGLPKDEKALSPFELYVLLVAILLHDAGNYEGRKDHEKKPYDLLQKMGDVSGADDVQKRAIADVAQAHGGTVDGYNKDTIGALPETREHGSIIFRPRILAALLRFADEICEHRGRGARILLKHNALPPKSVVYHAYAECITSARPDRTNKSLEVVYDIPTGYLGKKLGKDAGAVYLTDEILERLEKMNCERIYCLRFMYPIVMIERINVTINILSDDSKTLKSYPLRIEDSGYPETKFYLATQHPELSGIKVKKDIDELKKPKAKAKPKPKLKNKNKGSKKK